MVESSDTTEANGSGSGFKPPYGSFVTMNRLFDRMADNGIPARIDRSYLSNMPGSVIATTTQALKALDLADDSLHPTPALVEIVENPDQRKSLLAGIIREKYAAQLALGERATTQQLETSLRALGPSGSTARKAIAFFLAAAKYAEVPVSPYFKTPKAPAAERKPRVKDETTPPEVPALPPPPPAPNVTDGLDPFIVGLIKRLPPPDTVFPEAKQDAWFDTARGIFKLIYKTEDPDDDPEPIVTAFAPHAGGGESG